jgi:glycogen(starch) synthase
MAIALGPRPGAASTINAAPLKILMVSEDVPQPNPGGLARHAVVLSNALTRAGHEVVFLGTDAYLLEHPAQDTRLECSFRGAISLRRTGWKEQQLGFFNYGKRWYLARRLARAIIRHGAGCDVVHYHGHHPDVANFLPETLNFVQTRHDQGSDCVTHIRFRRGDVCNAVDARECARCLRDHPNALQETLSRASVVAFRRAVSTAFGRHKTIHVSEMLRRNARRVLGGVEAHREWVIHNFVDLQALREAIPVEDPREEGFLVVGRLDAAKGIADFAARWKSAGAGAGLPLHVVGDGTERSRIESIADGVRVVYHGPLPYVRVAGMVARSRFMVVPSLCEEPCATTVLESLALGKTVLALNRGGTPELRRHALYENQLRLFDSLEGIVAEAARMTTHCSPLAPRAAVGRFRWGVDDAVPAILDVYRA